MIRRSIVVIVLILTMSSWAAPSALAKSKPIQQLPKDVLWWSTRWVEVPKQMYTVGQDDGLLAGLVWGPAKGTVVILESTTKELWNTAKPDKRPGQQPSSLPKGLIFRYEF